MKIDSYTKYVLSDANIKFSEYMKINKLTNPDIMKYLGVSVQLKYLLHLYYLNHYKP